MIDCENYEKSYMQWNITMLYVYQLDSRIVTNISHKSIVHLRNEQFQWNWTVERHNDHLFSELVDKS